MFRFLRRLNVQGDSRPPHTPPHARRFLYKTGFVYSLKHGGISAAVSSVFIQPCASARNTVVMRSQSGSSITTMSPLLMM